MRKLTLVMLLAMTLMVGIAKAAVKTLEVKTVDQQCFGECLHNHTWSYCKAQCEY